MPGEDEGVENAVLLSVVIPAYNEQNNVRTAISTCVEAVSALKVPFEVILINDGSTDETGAIAEAVAAEDPRVRVVHNSVNINVGASILVGYKLARGAIVTHNAMDLPFDPAELAKILPRFQNPDLALVVVERTDRSAHSPWRKITSIAHNWLVCLLFLSRLPDMNFVQVVRRSALDNLVIRARSPAFVTPEMIIRIRDAGLVVENYVSTFYPRKIGQGKFGKPRDILWTLADMISFWLERLATRGR